MQQASKKITRCSKDTTIRKMRNHVPCTGKAVLTCFLFARLPQNPKKVCLTKAIAVEAFFKKNKGQIELVEESEQGQQPFQGARKTKLPCWGNVVENTKGAFDGEDVRTTHSKAPLFWVCAVGRPS